MCKVAALPRWQVRYKETPTHYLPLTTDAGDQQPSSGERSYESSCETTLVLSFVLPCRDEVLYSSLWASFASANIFHGVFMSLHQMNLEPEASARYKLADASGYRIVMHGTCRLTLFLTISFYVGSCYIGGGSGFAQEIEQQAKADSAPSIARLISQLGDSQYPTREKAQEELRRMGTAAFDELLAAQDHPDVEIAQRARYLVRSIPIAWTLDSDPAEVKSFLNNFNELSRNERKTRAQHLATLPNAAGIEALCRIVRFEPDRVLSKQAALFIMSRPVPEEAGVRQKLADVIRDGTVDSKRPAVEWLMTYSRELEEPHSTLTDWDRITRAELATLAKTPTQSDRHVARELVRWQTKLLLNRNRPEEAAANFRRTYDLIEDEVADIYEVIDWAISHKLYAAPEEIATRFGPRIQGEARLLYRLAEAQLKLGNNASAEKTALSARQLNLKPPKLDEHLSIAELLYRRGLLDWAAGEYRIVIAEAKVDSEHSLQARDSLSRMLVDASRELEAAEVVEPLVEFAKEQPKESDVAQLINNYFLGNMHFWRGSYFARLGDRDKQMEHLSKAIEVAPKNIDILIAMYRVPNPDEKWKQDVQRRIDAHLGRCRTTIKKYEEIIRSRPNMEGMGSDQLATDYNELAWLISNTAGDFQEAVKASQRSLELSPNNEAYLDTLGRCYYAAGDFEKAVESQRKAVEAAPHIQVMQRQLKLFEEALAKSKAAPVANPQNGMR